MFDSLFPDWNISHLLDTSTRLGQIVELLIYAVVAAVVTTVILLVYSKFVKSRLKEKNNLTVRFTQNIIRTVIILLAILWVLMSSKATTDIGKVVFQGTAILGAVFGLAAQPVLGDFFSGIAITMNRPFEIGDWLELEDGTVGVVADITPRHVVLKSLGTVDIIIPNSKINSLMIRDTSYRKLKSSKMSFAVAYGTDVDRVRSLVLEALKQLQIKDKYGRDVVDSKRGVTVRFDGFGDNSINLKVVQFTTVDSHYTYAAQAQEIIYNTLNENGIEIPFPQQDIYIKTLPPES